MRWLVTGNIKARGGRVRPAPPLFQLRHGEHLYPDRHDPQPGRRVLGRGQPHQKARHGRGRLRAAPPRRARRATRSAPSASARSACRTICSTSTSTGARRWSKGLSLDAALFHRGTVAARIDNLVIIPARAQLNLGGRYQFKLAGKPATFRLQAGNIFDAKGFGTAGPGIFAANCGRFLTGYLAVDV